MQQVLIFWSLFFAVRLVYGLKSGWLGKILQLSLPLVIIVWSLWLGRFGFTAVGLILAISHLRTWMARYGQERLTRVVKRTWNYTLILAASVSGLSWLGGYRFEWLLSIIGVIWLLVGLRALILSQTRKTKYNFKVRDSSATDKTLPTVTLAIPARNETHVLTDCLRAASSSDYAKLEILVLDDCSQDSTASIIQSFAHDGIRFIGGKEPASGWIGKNQAYETLLKEASGDIIIFAGVDTRLQPQSISLLIKQIKTNNLKLLSVMPYRDHFDWLPSMTRTLRYYLQLAFSGRPVMNLNMISTSLVIVGGG